VDHAGAPTRSKIPVLRPSLAPRSPAVEQSTPPESPVLGGRPAPFEALLIKHGVPWRGTYERVLRISGEYLATVDPLRPRAPPTNSWHAPTDVAKAVVRTSASSAAVVTDIEMHLKLWGGALGIGAPPVRFSVGGSGAAVVTALEGAGVAIERP
jgi:hypothetical protein